MLRQKEGHNDTNLGSEVLQKSGTRELTQDNKRGRAHSSPQHILAADGEQSNPAMPPPTNRNRKTQCQANCGRSSRFRIDFERVNRAAVNVLPALLGRWLPGGRIMGDEYVVCNPRRADRTPGSFRINTRSGRWADFAVEGTKGGDIIALAAYLAGIDQAEAAERLAEMLGIEARNAR